MGLDSVELVMDFEIFFNFKIPDPISERLRTVQDVVSYISGQINFANTGTDIKSSVLKQLVNEWTAMGIVISTADINKKISYIIPCNDEHRWNEFASKSVYKIPVPFVQGKLVKYLDKLFPSTRINYQDTTIDRFLDLVCAVNYKKLLNLGAAQNEYEVLIGVMGTTIDKLGVDPFEVFATSNFVNDLGLS